mmetsp:Transcript_30990/g.70881  ORF Transcript_30990/g.70881 Transcript_30990/m.70881 type:complete len:207 (+) Transcript_30990:491-1111(+)
MRPQLDDRIERNGDVRRLLPTEPHHVRVQNSMDALMSHHQHRLPDPLHLVRQRLQPQHDVHVRLAARIAIGELVRLTPPELLGIFHLNLFVGHAVAASRVQLVQVAFDHVAELDPVGLVVVVELPADCGMFEELGGLFGAVQGARPKADGHDAFFGGAVVVGSFLYGHFLFGVDGQAAGIFDASFGEARVAANFTEHVILRLSVAR